MSKQTEALKLAQDLRALAEQPAQQQEAQIVRWNCPCGNEVTFRGFTEPPASKPWVGLSTDEIYDMYNEPRSDAEMVEFARAIEVKLKERNA